MTDQFNGCPVCGWEGEVARTHDHSHRYYTHIVVQDGEMFRGKTCSMRTSPRNRSLLSRFFGIFRSQDTGTDREGGDEA